MSFGLSVASWKRILMHLTKWILLLTGIIKCKLLLYSCKTNVILLTNNIVRDVPEFAKLS